MVHTSHPNSSNVATSTQNGQQWSKCSQSNDLSNQKQPNFCKADTWLPCYAVYVQLDIHQSFVMQPGAYLLEAGSQIQYALLSF